MLKELIQEISHVLARYDWGKKTENPLARVDVGPDITLSQPIVELGKVSLHK